MKRGEQQKFIPVSDFFLLLFPALPQCGAAITGP